MQTSTWRKVAQDAYKYTCNKTGHKNKTENFTMPPVAKQDHRKGASFRPSWVNWRDILTVRSQFLKSTNVSMDHPFASNDRWDFKIYALALVSQDLVFLLPNSYFVICYFRIFFAWFFFFPFLWYNFYNFCWVEFCFFKLVSSL